MSETAPDTVALTTQTTTPQRPINVRKAMAGIRLMSGFGSLADCLEASGFSRHTARVPAAKGLSGKECVEEAKRLVPAADPAKMLATMRERATLAIHNIDETTPIQHVARMLDTIEKYHGGHEINSFQHPVSVVHRLELVQQLVVIARERGMELPAATVARTIDVTPGESRSSCDTTRKKRAIPPMSDNPSYVYSGKKRGRPRKDAVIAPRE